MKTRRILLLVVMLLAAGFVVGNKDSQAKTPGIVKLKVNKQYKKYDVTCDGKKDTVKVVSKTSKKTEKNTMKLIINGKTVYKNKEYYASPTVQLLQMKKKTTLLVVCHIGENDYGPRGIFSYKGSKWKKLISLTGDTKSYDYETASGSVKSVTADTVTVNYFAQNAFTGLTKYTKVYNYAGGALTPDPELVDVSIFKLISGNTKYKKNETLTAKQELPVYESTDTTSTQVATINPGDDVVFHKIIHVNGRPWFQVTVGEVDGYIQCQKFKYDYDDTEEGGSGYYFKNVGFAG